MNTLEYITMNSYSGLKLDIDLDGAEQISSYDEDKGIITLLASEDHSEQQNIIIKLDDSYGNSALVYISINVEDFEIED